MSKPPQHVIDELAAVDVDPENIKKAVEEGRAMRREFEAHPTGCDWDIAALRVELARIAEERDAQRIRADNTATAFGIAHKDAGELRSKLRRFRGWRVRYEFATDHAGTQWKERAFPSGGLICSRDAARCWANSCRESGYRNVVVVRVYAKERV